MPKRKTFGKPTLSLTEISLSSGKRVQRKVKIELNAERKSDLVDDTTCTRSLSENQTLVEEPRSEPRDANKERRQRRLDGWSEMHEQMIESWTEGESVCNDKCRKCLSTCDKLIHCSDCSFGTIYCERCYLGTHSLLPWHQPSILQEGCFVPCKIPIPDLCRYDEHRCEQKYSRCLDIIDEAGRNKKVNVEFCSCESESCTLVRHRIWPGSPRQPRLGFKFGFMEWTRCLRLEGQVSVNALVNAVVTKTSMGTIKMTERNIYKPLLDCLEEYVIFRKQMSDLSDIVDDKSSMCYACPAEDERNPSKIVFSADANFGLVRKKSAGSQIDMTPRELFVDQTHLDSFLQQYSNTADKTQECSNFQVGNALRGKKKTQKLDEKALFGVACRHEIPILFCSIKTEGERLGYIVYLMEKLREMFPTQNKVMMYDVACLLDKHLKKSETHGHLLDDYQLVLPAFHAYGHARHCQEVFGPKIAPGIGMSDGEVMERLWSYLRKFSGMTKVMSPEHRNSVLNEALLHYGQQKLQSLGTTLLKRMQRALEAEKTAAEVVTQLTQDAGFDLTSLKQQLDNGTITPERESSTNGVQNQYIFQLQEYYTLINGSGENGEVSPEMSSLDVQLKKQEKKRKIPRPGKDSIRYKKELLEEADRRRNLLMERLLKEKEEGRWLQTLIRKYADGQAIYAKINSSLVKSQKKMTKMVKQYNDLKCFPCASDMNREITVNSVLPSEDGCVNLTNVKAQCVDLLCRQARAKEEQTMLLQEMRRVDTNYGKQRDKLQEKLSESHHSCNSQYERGFQARIKKQLAYVEIGHQRTISCWTDFISSNLCDMHMSALLGFIPYASGVEEEIELVSSEDSGSESD